MGEKNNNSDFSRTENDSYNLHQIHEENGGVNISLHVDEKPRQQNLQCIGDEIENASNGGSCQWIEAIGECLSKRGKHVVHFVLFVGYIVYMVFAIKFDPQGAVFVCCAGSALLLHRIVRTLNIDIPKLLYRIINTIKMLFLRNVRKSKVPRIAITSMVSLALVVFLIVDVVKDDPQRLMSLIGLAVFIVLLVVTSKAPRKINWISVIWGLLLQFILGIIILRWPPGFAVCLFLGDQISILLGYTDAGSKFIFGEETYTMHPVAFKIVPTIFFFSSLISVMYHLNIMQKIIKGIAIIFRFAMRTTATESFGTAVHIFVGQIQSSLALKPFLNDMTSSELHALMTSGFATVAGSIVAVYVEFGIPAEHVISASFMSAPASLAVSKIGWPETEETVEVDADIELNGGAKLNLLEAVSVGAASSVKHTAYVVVNIISFLAFLAFIDAVVQYLGARVGYPNLSFELICSYLFFPLVVSMGVPINDARKVGKLIGKKLFTNEFIAYADLGEMKKSGEIEGKTLIISTYILCGFGSISTIGVVMGAMTAAEPRIQSKVSRGIVRALIAGNIACFMTACIAAILSQEEKNMFTLNSNSTFLNDTDRNSTSTD